MQLPTNLISPMSCQKNYSKYLLQVLAIQFFVILFIEVPKAICYMEQLLLTCILKPATQNMFLFMPWLTEAEIGPEQYVGRHY